LKIVLIFFSVIYLFATEANIKYSPSKNALYIYIKSKEFPKKYSFPTLAIDNGNIEFIKNFKFIHNETFFIGKQYKVIFNGKLIINPLKISYNSKIYKTPKLVYNPNDFKNLDISIKINHQKSHFLDILIIFNVLYLIALFIVYKRKIYQTKKEIGYFDDDIKKFYYFLALNNFEEVEILNKHKSLFKKKVSHFDKLANYIVNKIVKKEMYKKEFTIFSVTLILLILWKGFR